MIRPVPLFLVLVGLAACGETPPEPIAAATGLAAPAWVMTGPGGEFSLEDASGRPVVLQFGAADADAWAALEAAQPDLEAAGALVVGAVTEGALSSLRLPFAAVADSGGVIAQTYGYIGQPLVVVIDAEGRLRSRAENVATTDQFFDLAANALLEADDVDAPLESASELRVPMPVAPAEVDDLVREGAALLDVRPEGDLERDGPIPFALVCPVEAFAPEVLPMNALVPIILAGPNADALALDAIAWGYREVYTLSDASVLADPDADELTLPDLGEPSEPESRFPVRRRAIG